MCDDIRLHRRDEGHNLVWRRHEPGLGPSDTLTLPGGGKLGIFNLATRVRRRWRRAVRWRGQDERREQPARDLETSGSWPGSQHRRRYIRACRSALTVGLVFAVGLRYSRRRAPTLEWVPGSSTSRVKYPGPGAQEPDVEDRSRRKGEKATRETVSAAGDKTVTDARLLRRQAACVEGIRDG